MIGRATIDRLPHAAVALLGVVTSGCLTQPGTFCHRDDDCAAGLRCTGNADQRGVCVYPEALPDTASAGDAALADAAEDRSTGDAGDLGDGLGDGDASDAISDALGDTPGDTDTPDTAADVQPDLEADAPPLDLALDTGADPPADAADADANADGIGDATGDATAADLTPDT